MTQKAFYVLADFEENLKTNTKGKNYVAKCPKCEKWNLYISKTTGLYNCFTGGCDFKGILLDFVPAKPVKDDTASGNFYPKVGRFALLLPVLFNIPLAFTRGIRYECCLPTTSGSCRKLSQPSSL